MFNNVCEMSPYLAYAMIIYIVASLYYFIQTRNIGTPFRNSLTHKQIKIKEMSTLTRKNIFIQGIILAISIVLLFTPFSKC